MNQYREGKVKSTPGGEWNSSWNHVPTSCRSTFTCDGVPLAEWTGESWLRARLRWKNRSRSESESEMGVRSTQLCTRNQVTYPCPGWRCGKTHWRTEPVSVENGWDEVWVAVKFQTNLEIAGSLRNSFRASLGIENDGGRALFGLGAHLGLPNSDKLRMPFIYIRESDCEW